MVQIPFWFNLIICFPSQKTQNQSHALTTQWTSIQRGDINYSSVSPQNVCLVFTSEKLAIILQATTLSIPVIMDLLSWILKGCIPTSLLNSEMIPFLQNTLTIGQTPSGPLTLMVYYTTSDTSIFTNSQQSSTPCSSVLTWPFPAGHFSQTKTLHQSACITIVQTPGLHQGLLQVDCTTVPMPNLCAQPYGLLKHTNPWNSNSMDFIEKLPPFFLVTPWF